MNRKNKYWLRSSSAPKREKISIGACLFVGLLYLGVVVILIVGIVFLLQAFGII